VEWAYHDGTLFLFPQYWALASLLDYEPDAPLVALGAAYENLVLEAMPREWRSPFAISLWSMRIYS